MSFSFPRDADCVSLAFRLWLLAGLLLPNLAFAQDAASTPQTPPVLLQMIRDDSVHQELGLRDDQIRPIRQAHAEVDGRWWRSRNLPPDKNRMEIEGLTAELQQSLRSILDPDQQQRLDQLRRQALGTRMLTLQDVVEALSIDDRAHRNLIATFLDTDRKAAEIQAQVQQAKQTQQEAQREIEQLKDAERKQLMSLLSQDQRAKIGSLRGKPFDFAQVKRMYPLAPDLATEGVSWVQGSPVTMEQFRGKVVAVHFYAYQCHNCVANLPHYNAWHGDYAGDGLVVIGIQTPETSLERRLTNVATAAKRDGIEYPVLLDATRSNWNAWGNQVWPTVYLVDKKGFIRRWWCGEMNWKGTQGEKDMRRTIESLLAEES